MKEISHVYARILKKNKLEQNQTMFPASFVKQDEDYQILDQIELYINLDINQNLTQSDINYIDVRFQLEQQIRNQGSKDTGRRLDIFDSMTIFFLKNYRIE